MKILQLCHKPPFPPVDGGTIAMHSITEGLLQKGHQVKVIAVSTPKHKVNLADIPEEYLQKTGFETVFIDTTITLFGIFKAFLSNKSYHVNRFVSKELNQKLTEILQKETFDIIQLESIFVAPYISTIKAHSQARIVLRTHNIEYRIWERIASHEENILKKILLRNLTRKLKRYEFSIFGKIEGYMTISRPDFQFFHEAFPDVKGTVIPFGIDVSHYSPESDYIPSEYPELFHIGSMDWRPNQEGIAWFLKNVWGEITERFPMLTFTLAGRGLSEKCEKYNMKNVIIAGEVEDANAFILSKDIMIVPLLSGSGIRIKIIEGMALGKTIITTSIGVEGIDAEHGKDIFIANEPEEFVEIVEKCIKTPDLCKIIGENARNFVILHHNNEVITNKIVDFYHQLIQQAPGKS